MIRKAAIMVLVLGAWAAPILAQKAPTAPKTYNPAAEVTISGTIKHVVGIAGPDGTVGVHLDVETEKNGQLAHVHLGPALFIGMNNFSFLAEDKVEIVGAKVLHDGEVALWARLVKKGDQTLTLRNEDGTPKWQITADDVDGCGVVHKPVR